MPRMEYLLRDENYQRRVDTIAANALGLAVRANERWDRIFQADGTPAIGDCFSHFVTLNRLVGKTIGLGGIAELSPIITDRLNVITDVNEA